jgi:hypothetical protein
MAIVFVSAVNAVLKRVGEIAGDSEELATSTVTSTATGLVATDAFTDSRRQHKIDIVIQLWNEAAHEVFRMGAFNAEVASATLITVAAQREYDLPSDFERMCGKNVGTRVLRGATSGTILTEYYGGYEQMMADQPQATQFTGDSSYYAISPVASKIRLSAEPTSNTASQTYNYLYHKRISLSSTMATQTLPFSDSVADALVPVVSEVYERIQKKEMEPGLLTAAINRSLEFLSQTERRDRYGKR